MKFIVKMICIFQIFRTLHSFLREVEEIPVKGEMLEWLKRHAWKACIRQKRIAGSNPAFSAMMII